ncbi:hypothetical protein SAMN04515671_0746 [Nakamurella panacisegetis]|uniref:Uncharacterized protein n=1 Tax=Nakamurella panacisegetis TaxID=1090615 RepID=A0A1H0J1V4_9ACTN|nr:DUF5336 domain-containing protein [Nakamurella panacisegetis]SDO37714.1 hypothetical protein SAMN04515671_0746 [Nakamurella panacisegetis]
MTGGPNWNSSYPSGYDPVTGQPLPPGPPAYSAVDPYASAPAPGYPPVGYQLVPIYPMYQQQPPKPGGAVAAAVLSFVQAGFVLMGALVILTGAAGFDSVDRSLSSEFTVIGILTMIAGGLLIAGGVTILGRRPALLGVGCGLSIAISVYFVIRLSDYAGLDFAIWVPLIYAVLPIIAIALSLGADVRAWSRNRNVPLG